MSAFTRWLAREAESCYTIGRRQSAARHAHDVFLIANDTALQR